MATADGEWEQGSDEFFHIQKEAYRRDTWKDLLGDQEEKDCDVNGRRAQKGRGQSQYAK